MKNINPNARWWIKADGTDIQTGLRESVRKEWSGDVDWGDNALQKCHKEYMAYLKFVQSICRKTRKADDYVKLDLQKQNSLLSEEKLFLQKGYDSMKAIYEKKRQQVGVSEQSLFAIAWDLEGYSKLIQENDSMSKIIDNILESMLTTLSPDKGNISLSVSNLKKKLEEYVKGLYLKKRQAASHLLLFMISDEQRNQKPYAIPVRVLKYATITDAKIRELKEELRVAMKELGMVPVGNVLSVHNP